MSYTIDIGFSAKICPEGTPNCSFIFETFDYEKIIAFSANNENLMETYMIEKVLHWLVEEPMLASKKNLNLVIIPEWFFLAILQAIAIDYKLHPELLTAIPNVQKDSNKLLVVKTLGLEGTTVFDESVEASCGWNNIIMNGTLEDWINLKNKAEKLLKYCSNQLQEKWRTSLLPLLNVFIDEYQNKEMSQKKIDFWCSMCKLGGNGWINIFFPYIKDKSNKFCMS